jgi:hypothetical protein
MGWFKKTRIIVPVNVRDIPFLGGISCYSQIVCHDRHLDQLDDVVGKINKRLDALEADDKIPKVDKASSQNDNIPNKDKALKKTLEDRKELRKKVLDLQQYIMMTSNRDGCLHALLEILEMALAQRRICDPGNNLLSS